MRDERTSVHFPVVHIVSLSLKRSYLLCVQYLRTIVSLTLCAGSVLYDRSYISCMNVRRSFSNDNNWKCVRSFIITSDMACLRSVCPADIVADEG
uniref:Uncharacterized protein n=1 Tax=Pyxicephalus adspersus TaxID=30357 RepID=A0AAV3AAX4_PYXAD|nr:TPA: hypothetical protein GDO54_014544 [Pyxicephalus adspersus]